MVWRDLGSPSAHPGDTGQASPSRPLPDLQPPWQCREQRGTLEGQKGPGTPSPSADPRCLLLFPSAPSIPTQLRLSPGSSTSLVASWAGAGGAAWLHLVLRNLLTQTVTTTLSARRGLTTYTFQHLQPGTQYWLGLSATAGPYTAGGPNATAWTCEYDGQGWGRTSVALAFSLPLLQPLNPKVFCQTPRCRGQCFCSDLAESRSGSRLWGAAIVGPVSPPQCIPRDGLLRPGLLWAQPVASP